MDFLKLKADTIFVIVFIHSFFNYFYLIGNLFGTSFMLFTITVNTRIFDEFKIWNI